MTGQTPTPKPKRNYSLYGLLIGIALGVAVGAFRNDLGQGAGLAVAFGISFAFLAPLVRTIGAKQTSEAAADDSAAPQEHDK